MGSEPPGEVRDRLHDVLLSRIGWGWVRVRERLVVGVRGGVWRRGCVLGACMCCVRALACPGCGHGCVLEMCGLKVKVSVRARSACSAVTCGAWRALVRREPGQGDVAGDGTLELWSLCGWAQIRVEVTLRFLWELWSAD